MGYRRRQTNIGTRPSRRKWAMRGRAVGDFSSALVFSIAQNTISFGVWCCRRVGSGFSTICRRTKQKESSGPKGRQVVSLRNSSMFKPIDRKEMEKVTFGDIVGLYEAKNQIKQRVILPIEHKKKAELLKIKKGGGVLLIGPPGNGKTMLAKGVANMINAPFFHITPGDLISHNPGVSEVRVHEMFMILRSYKLAVLFMDDVEALLPSRKMNTSTIMKRVVAQYLIEMQGFESNVGENTLLIVAATNEPDMIDPAVMRTGRFDERIFVPPPNIKEREMLLRNCMKGVLISDDVDCHRLAAMTRFFSCADLAMGLVESAKRIAFEKSTKLRGNQTVRPVSMADFLAVLRKNPEPSVGVDKLLKYGVDVEKIT